jgi:hypothetical protein
MAFANKGVIARAPKNFLPDCRANWQGEHRADEGGAKLKLLAKRNAASG